MGSKQFPIGTEVTPQATDKLLLADSSDSFRVKDLLLSDLQSFIDTNFATDADLTAHTSLTNNPHSVALTQLIDLSITAVDDNEVLAYDSGSGNWINQTAAEAGISETSHTHAVDDLSDIVITPAVADNEVLAFDSGSGDWINQTAAEAGLAIATHTHTLGSLSDVVITSISDNEILQYDSGSGDWINRTFAEAGIALTDLTNVTTTEAELDQALDGIGGTVTAANLTSLTDNSVANTLHRHSELVASDGSPDPALSVDADGLVDVGASGGGARLNVSTNLNIIHSSGAAEVNIIGTGDSHNFANIVFRSDEVTDKKWAIHHRQASPETNDLSFKYHNGTAWSDIVTFENGGNVGIGTTDPSTELHVVGDITVTGTVDGIDVANHTHTLSNITDVSTTETELDQALDGIGASVTAANLTSLTDNLANLTSLTDNSIVDALHRHSELVASDGSPDPVLSVDANGNVGIGTTDPLGLLTLNNAGQAEALGVTSDVYYVQTSDDTPTTIAAIGTNTNRAYHIKATVVAITSAGAASYVRHGSFWNDVGVLSQVGTTSNIHDGEDGGGYGPAWDVTLDTSGTDIIVQVTGEVDTSIKWQATIERHIITD